MDKGKVHTTICHRRTKKPKFDFSMVVAGFLVSTTLLSTTLTTPAYAREVYKIPTSTSSVTSTTNILDTSAYELSQFKALVKQGIIDVAMLESVYHSLNDMLNDVDDGKVDTYSAEFISYVADATVCFDKIDVSNMSIINDMGMRDTYLDESRRFLGALGESISFVDVKADDWFYKNVQSTTAHGLINGIGDSKFNPQGTLTIAEAIKLVASANAYYNNDLDSLSVSTSGHWVSNYLTYAQQKGIVTTSYSDLDSAITRGQMAELFARALPASEYAQINDFNNAKERNVSDAVKTLYTSGIMIGDDTGSFRVNDTITRAETAAIINRVIIPDARVKVEEGMTKPTDSTLNTSWKALPYYTDSTQRPTYNPKTINGINVLYNHTYGCKNQEEYDAVMNAIQEAYDAVMPTYELYYKTQDTFEQFVNNEVDYEARQKSPMGYIFNRFMDYGEDVQYEAFKAFDMKGAIFEYLRENYIKQGNHTSDIKAPYKDQSAYIRLFFPTKSTCVASASLSMAVWDVMGYNSCMYGSTKANHAGEGYEINGIWFVNWFAYHITPEDLKAWYAPDLVIDVQPTI